jgi:hypothetical protein
VSRKNDKQPLESSSAISKVLLRQTKDYKQYLKPRNEDNPKSQKKDIM